MVESTDTNPEEVVEEVAEVTEELTQPPPKTGEPSEEHKGLQRVIAKGEQRIRELETSQASTQELKEMIQRIQEDQALLVDQLTPQGEVAYGEPETPQRRPAKPSKLDELRSQREKDTQNQKAWAEYYRGLEISAEGLLTEAGLTWDEFPDIKTKWQQNPIEAYGDLQKAFAKKIRGASEAPRKASPEVLEAETTPSSPGGNWDALRMRIAEGTASQSDWEQYEKGRRERGL